MYRSAIGRLAKRVNQGGYFVITWLCFKQLNKSCTIKEGRAYPKGNALRVWTRPEAWEGCNAVPCHNYCVSRVAVCRMVRMRSRRSGIVSERAVKVPKRAPDRGSIATPQWSTCRTRNAWDHRVFFILGGQSSAEEIRLRRAIKTSSDARASERGDSALSLDALLRVEHVLKVAAAWRIGEGYPRPHGR